MSKMNPFKYYKSSPSIIKLAIMYYVRYPLSLRQVEDILYERGIDICHETVRYWWQQLGSVVAKELKRKRLHAPSFSTTRNDDESFSINAIKSF